MGAFLLILVFFDFPLQLPLGRFPDLESCEAAFTEVEVEIARLAVPKHLQRLRCFEIDRNGHVVTSPLRTGAQPAAVPAE